MPDEEEVVAGEGLAPLKTGNSEAAAELLLLLLPTVVHAVPEFSCGVG